MALRDFCVTLLCINGRCCANSELGGAISRKSLISKTRWCVSYEPGGRGFKSCRARQTSKGVFRSHR